MRFRGGIANDMEAPGLAIVSGGRTYGGLDHSGDDRLRNRIGQEAAHGAPPGNDGIQVGELGRYFVR
jgi:hypothetical protein